MHREQVSNRGLTFTILRDAKDNHYFILKEVLKHCDNMKRHDFLELIGDLWPQNPIRIAVDGKIVEIIRCDVVLVRTSIARKPRLKALATWILSTFHLETTKTK